MEELQLSKAFQLLEPGPVVLLNTSLWKKDIVCAERLATSVRLWI